MKNGKLEVTFIPVYKQTNGFNSGLIALGCGSIFVDNKSPVDDRFVVNEMHNHFMKCLKEAYLYSFATLGKAVNVSSNKLKFFIF